MDVAGESIRVVSAVAEPLMADGIHSAIEAADGIGLVGTATTGEHAVELVHDLQPDVAIVDWDLPQLSGVDLITSIKQEKPTIGVLVLTDKIAYSCLFSALRAGMGGCVFKSISRGQIVSAIRSIYTGEAVFDISMVHEIAERLSHVKVPQRPSNNNVRKLAEREKEIIKLASGGYTNREIANSLSISERTVQSHFGSIFRKLQVGSRTEAVLYAFREGLLMSDALKD